jgi:hypothetical protein
MMHEGSSRHVSSLVIWEWLTLGPKVGSRGALPHQLALEVLDSMQKVLFPLDDPKSRILLSSLTSTSGFDPDCLRFEFSSIQNAEEKDISYYYSGARLLLCSEMENPTQRGIEKWCKVCNDGNTSWHHYCSSVGILGLAVSVYQAWVGYQEWQHPVLSSI